MSDEVAEWMEDHVASLSCVTRGLVVQWRLVTVGGREFCAMSLTEVIRRRWKQRPLTRATRRAKVRASRRETLWLRRAGIGALERVPFLL